MEKLNKTKIILYGGIVLMCISLFLLFSNTTNASAINVYEGNDISGLVIVSEDLKCETEATDEMFDISLKEPVLIRNVEMVQWYEDEDGVRMVLANYPLPSFEKDSAKYDNPDFPFGSEIFYGETRIKGLILEEKYLDAITEEYFESDKKFNELKDLPEENALKYKMVLNDNVYVSASDEWQIGELRVFYTYIGSADLKDYTFIGRIGDGSLIYPDSEKIIMYDHSVSLDEVKEDRLKDNTVNYLLMITGAGAAAYAYYLSRKKKTEPEVQSEQTSGM